jgi:nucleotide-binding universal stress UspA family protein
MFERLLVPLDGSALAEVALKPALAVAERFESEVLLLRVIVPPEAAVEAFQGDMYARLRRQWDQDAQAEAQVYLRRLQHEHAQHGVRVRLHTQIGAPPAQIVAVAGCYRADLIVMSTHGRSGISRMLFGSVAEAVLRGADVPVLLVPVREGR